MKLANSHASGNIISSEGIQTTSAFGIARTPHMFNILSSGLYSDKIAAVLREISCNAMDAHIMGGTPDKPFQVKLPTPLDRSFYVKDWGPGLNDQEVRELYTTYGWSSKQNNDDVTGAFGLGSKSPFAYTTQNEEDSDGFTIVSTKDGMKRIYTCHIGDDGAPAISRLYEGPADADWPHGVMVTFPVQSRDIAEFHQKAVEIYQWFRVKPELLGLSGKLATPKFDFQGSFFSMKRNDNGADRGASVITGNVRYPINQSRLGNLSQIEEALLTSSIHMHLPIGQVMMTPSREELQYTEQTKANLKQHLSAAAKEVAERVREYVLTPEPTRWAWFKKIHSYHASLPHGVQFRIEKFLEAAGVPEEEIKQVSQAVKENTIEVPGWVGDGIGGPAMEYELEGSQYKRDEHGNRIPVHRENYHGARVYVYQYDKARDAVSRREFINGRVAKGGDKHGRVQLSFLASIHVYYADDKLADQRVRAAVREGECTYAMLVTPCKGTPQSYAAEYAARVVGKKGLDGVPCFGVSTLAIPDAVEEARERRRRVKELGPRATYADHEVHYLSLNGNVARTTLGELEDSDLFYMTATKLNDMRRGTVRNKADAYDHSFPGSDLGDVLRSMNVIAQELNLPVTGIVLMPTEGAARRMKLPEQGFKPFLPYFVGELKANRSKWEALTASVDRTPRVSMSSQYSAKQYGWLGTLGHEMHRNSDFWQRFESEFATSPVTHAVREFVKNSDDSKERNAAPFSPVLQALQLLTSKLTNHGLPDTSVKPMSYYQVQNVFEELAPSFEIIHRDIMCNWMRDSDNHEHALSIFRMALQLDGLADESSGRTLRLVA
jgi:hypothetical protein